MWKDLIASTGVLLAVHCPAASNLVVNGSFESYAKAPAQWTAPGFADYGILPGSTNVSGWMVINGPIAYLRTWAGADGPSTLDLSGSGNPESGGVSQTVATVPGTRYVLSFFLSGNPGSSFPAEPTRKTVRVRIDTLTNEFSFDTAVEQNSFADMKWRQKQLAWLATTNLATISIVNTARTNFTGPVIDSIVFSECEAPLLSVATTGPALVLSWPDTPCPIVLEASPQVGTGAVWQIDASIRIRTETGWAVTNRFDGRAQFFRLRLQ